MPLVDSFESSAVSLVETYKRELADFSRRICFHIDNAEWDKLPMTLEERQAYLESVFTQQVGSESHALTLLAELILEQDKIFLAKVHDQKDKSTQMQLSLERGRKAIQAYGPHT